MTAKIAFYVFGLGLTLVGFASYVGGLPLPIDCKSTVCTIGTTLVSLDLAMIIVGALLMLVGFLITKSRV